MDIFTLIDELEEMVEHGSRIPITGKVVLDAQSLLEYLDRLRTLLPEEVRQARWVTKERERVLQEAREEAKGMLEETERHVERLASETEVARRAQGLAGEIMDEARQAAEEVRKGANGYADEILGRLENSLEETLQTVRRGRSALQGRLGETG